MKRRPLALLFGSALALVVGADPAVAAPTADPAPIADPGASEAPSPAPAADASAAEPSAPDPATSATVLDTILPCGLRVIAARDASLPVASVVLAVEVGTSDDPKNLPGLVHALAYHLQQGNRELAPGAAIATAHDVGGIAAMAVGWDQVRFESLVPLSQLDAQLRVESLRLRAPTISQELWLKSLSYASSDDAIKHLLPPEAAAEAWQDPGMTHDGRRVGKPLAELLDQALGAQLAQLYDYRRSTLVVVGPEDPQALLARVEPLFKDLPARSRAAIPTPVTPPAAGAAARSIEIPRQAGDSMLWAVPGTPNARAWAQVLCGTINRQGRVQDEPRKARVRCTSSDDPRRPLLVLRAIGFDPATGPEPLIAGRLARIAALAEAPETEPVLARLVEDQRARIESQMSYDLHTPLNLATHLSSASERRGPERNHSERPLAEALGLPIIPDALADPEPTPASLASEDAGEATESADETGPAEASSTQAPSGAATRALLAAVPELFDTRRAVLLLAPDQAAPPPFHTDAPAGSRPAPSEPSPDAQPIEIESVPADEGPKPGKPIPKLEARPVAIDPKPESQPPSQPVGDPP